MDADGTQMEAGLRGAVSGDIFPELSRKIIGAAFAVHNELGPGFLEKVYENALLHELTQAGIAVEPQAEIPVEYKGHRVGLYYADLLVAHKVICEIKTVESLTPIHEAQLLHYLKATGVELGLLINFAKARVQLRRLVKSQ
jgi:GxxExxY protein